MDSKSRLRQYVKYRGISQNEFTQTAGLANGYLTKRGNVTSEHVAKIGEKYRDLNLEWVINGKGYMTKQVQENISFRTLNLREENAINKLKKLQKGHPEATIVLEIIEELVTSQNNTIRALVMTCESKDRLIEKQAEEIEKLKNELGNYKGKKQK